MTLQIQVQNLSFSYGGAEILRSIDFYQERNSLVAITGPSGEGKSTFLSIFNRLWEEQGQGRVEGRVEVDLGHGLQNIYAREISSVLLRQQVGMVFQIPNPLPFSIHKNIALALEVHRKWPKKDIDARVVQVLKDVDLYDEVKDRLSSPAQKLSGGQQQRLCIARALALDPQILLLDEPTSSLDEENSLKIEKLLVRLKEKCTILFVSHDQNQVGRIADRVYELKGRELKRTTVRVFFLPAIDKAR